MVGGMSASETRARGSTTRLISVGLYFIVMHLPAFVIFIVGCIVTAHAAPTQQPPARLSNLEVAPAGPLGLRDIGERVPPIPFTTALCEALATLRMGGVAPHTTNTYH